MSGPALLDINDSLLQLWHKGVAVQSPGYALLNGSQYTFGNAARGAARLRPRDINTHYWWQLSTESLQPALGPARHTADLVHAHLLDIHEQAGRPDELILAVSGSMQREQLALLLGIVGQCPFNAVGLINRSIALGSTYLCPTTLYHLEIQLHQAVVSKLVHNEGLLEVSQTHPLPGCGLLQLQERLIEVIASAFIRQTRFDPRRKAESEQQLYDSLPSLLRSSQSTPEANLEVMGYRARINYAELSAAGDLLFESVPQAMGILHPQDTVIVDPIAGLLPGLMERLPQAELIGEKTMSSALGRHEAALVQASTGDQALHFVTSLPALASSHAPADNSDLEAAAPTSPKQEAQITPPDLPPTHLLRDGLATVLSPAGMALGDNSEIYRQNSHWLIRGADTTRVNGEDYVPGQTLLCGDRIEWETEGGPSEGRRSPQCAQLIVVKTP